MITKRITALMLSGVIAAAAISVSGCSEKKEESSAGDTPEESSDVQTSAFEVSAASTASSQVSYGDFQGNKLTEKAELMIYQTYGSAGCVYLCRKNNINVDSGYLKKLTGEAKQFISGLELKNVGSSELAKLICTDNTLNLGMKDKLFDELHKRYNKETNLFDEFENDTYEGIDEEKKLVMQISSTDIIWTELNAFGLKDDTYDIKKLLCDAFNANVDKYNHNDIYNGVWTISSELENIFYYFLITDSIDSINYKPVWDVLGPNYLRNVFETNENVDGFVEISAENLSAVTTDQKAKEKLGVDIKIKYTAQEYYNTFDTDAAFTYNPSGKDFFYFEYCIFTYLSQPSDLKLTENKYFTDNIGKWLKHCLENHGAV